MSGHVEDPVTYWGQRMHVARWGSPEFYKAELNFRAALAVARRAAAWRRQWEQERREDSL